MAWRGNTKSSTLKNVIYSHEHFSEMGKGSKFTKFEAERIMQQMLVMSYLEEELIETGRHGRLKFQVWYVKIGEKSQDLFSANASFKFVYRTSRNTDKQTQGNLDVNTTPMPCAKKKSKSKTEHLKPKKNKKRKSLPIDTKENAENMHSFAYNEVIRIDSDSDELGDSTFKTKGQNRLKKSKDSHRLSRYQQRLLLKRLKKWTMDFAETKGVSAFQVLTPAAQEECAKICPVTLEELKQCEGFSLAKVEFLGELLIGEILTFMNEKSIKTDEPVGPISLLDSSMNVEESKSVQGKNQTESLLANEMDLSEEMIDLEDLNL